MSIDKLTDANLTSETQVKVYEDPALGPTTARKTTIGDIEAAILDDPALNEALLLAIQHEHAGMILSINGAPVTENSIGEEYVLLDIFDLITVQSSTVATLSPNYDITMAIDGIYRVDFWASVSSSANNELITFAPHVNGHLGLVEVDQFIGTGSDTSVVAMNALITYSAGDKLDIRVKVNSGTTNLTFLAAGLSAFRIG